MDDKPRSVSEQGTPSRAGGRPEYKPTADQRARVRDLRSNGGRIGAIAKAIGLAPATLRKHFAEELQKPATPAAPDQQLDLVGQHKPAAPPPVPAAAESVPPGRPPFEPTDRQRQDVKLCKAVGWSNEEIAAYIGVSRNTLAEHFVEELAHGVRVARVLMLRRLWAQVLGGNMTAFDRFSKLKGMVNPADLPDDFLDDDLEPEDDTAGLGKKEQANRAAVVAPPEGSPWAKLAPNFKPH